MWEVRTKSVSAIIEALGTIKKGLDKNLIDQKDEGTQDDRRRNGGTNFILRIKEQETRLTLQEYDDDNDNDDEDDLPCVHFFLLALQPIVGLYFAALQRGYSLLAHEVS